MDWAIIDAILRDPGITSDALAKQLGYCRNIIALRRANPAVRMEIEQLKRDEIEEILRIRRKAIRRIERIIDHGNDRDAKTVAMKIMDGLPEIAAGLLKPNDDGSGEPTTDEITALSDYANEVAGRETPDTKRTP